MCKQLEITQAKMFYIHTIFLRFLVALQVLYFDFARFM